MKIIKSRNIKLLLMITILVICMTTGVYASDVSTEGLALFENIIKFIAFWINKIGLVIAFFGAIQFILSIKSQNPEQKSNGIMFFVVGLMLTGVSSDTALSTFGLIS